MHDAFVEKVKAKVDAMKMGDPLDEATDIGTIISKDQHNKVQVVHRGWARSTPGATCHECSSTAKRTPT